jgi:hypothetical protein
MWLELFGYCLTLSGSESFGGAVFGFPPMGELPQILGNEIAYGPRWIVTSSSMTLRAGSVTSAASASVAAASTGEAAHSCRIPDLLECLPRPEHCAPRSR